MCPLYCGLPLEDSLWSEKSVLIIGMFAFQGEAYISRMGQIDHWDIIKLSTLRGCPQGGFRLYSPTATHALNSHVVADEYPFVCALGRHVYKPMISAGYGRLAAAVAVFGISAFFHELVISIALHTVKLWAFSAMLMQVWGLQGGSTH